jgi:ring-1,2-phenylacetyl-CoA epoxidase subunit PaaD
MVKEADCTKDDIDPASADQRARLLDLALATASEVPDPELPMLTIAELGMLRGIQIEQSKLTVSITPTYLGCPAIEHMAKDIRDRLSAKGFEDVDVQIVLNPPWSSDWISKEGREKLARNAIVPPKRSIDIPRDKRLIPLRGPEVACPSCGSLYTRTVSRFGATACRSLMACNCCGEPFEYFKEA